MKDDISMSVVPKKRYFKLESDQDETSPGFFVREDSDNSDDDGALSKSESNNQDHMLDNKTSAQSTTYNIPIDIEPIVVDSEGSDDEIENGREEGFVFKSSQPKVQEKLQSCILSDHLFGPGNPQPKPEPEPERWTRYIGSLTLQAWATRPTMRPLPYKRCLIVKRLTPKKITFGKLNERSTAKFGDSSVVRLFSEPEAGNREIGRLPADITDIISPLMDLNIIEVSSHVIMDTESRLSIGDSFYVQLEFRLKQEAFTDDSNDFADPGHISKKAKKSGWNGTSESNEEAILRLRQASLVRLFEKVSLTESTTNENGGDPAIVIPDGNGETPIDQLDLDQLKQFYQANQQTELLQGLPETTTPPIENFKLDLRPYQRHGLSWMLSREKELDVLDKLSRKSDSEESEISTQTRANINEEGMMNPLWKSFRWPSKHQSRNSQEEAEYFYANLYSGELSIVKPIIKTMMRGGILADEMGLGKTISTLSLINSVPSDTDIPSEGFKKNYASNTTLIVVPMSLLSQWQSEFEKANNNSNHKCIVYYGDQTYSDLQQVLCGKERNIPIVMLTTYGTILNEYTRTLRVADGKPSGINSGLYSVKFFRIVLDEGHNIRNKAAKTTKAIYDLSLSRKWVLTGTPVINRLDDLYSLVKFLEVEPWNKFTYWKTFVTLPFEQKKIGQTLDVVKSILEPIFLRRTKNMKQKDGQPLVVLPPKEITIEEIKFSVKEQHMYDWFKALAARSFNEGMETGQLMKRYTQIFTHILRLRQVCCHMDLVGSASSDMPEDTENTVDTDISKETQGLISKMKQYNQGEGFENDEEIRLISTSLYEKVNFVDTECPICTLSPINISELTITTCGHTFCMSCILDHFNFQRLNWFHPSCPICRELISMYKLFKVRKSRKVTRIEPLSQPQDDREYVLYVYDPDRTSSKIQALIRHLRTLNTQCPGEQVVVFSQFSTYLDIIEDELNVQGSSDFCVFKFDGRLSMKNRKKVLDSFATMKESIESKNKTIILLLSLKAGGVGLNLTSASRAFMMDPWWSPSVEDQAIDRIHRIGQVENVKVVRFIMKDSIEQKMLKIQQRKKQIGEAVGDDVEERSKRRIEELQMLFEE